MTEEKLDSLLTRLRRRLGLDEPDGATVLLLEDSLLDAEGELLLYLNREQLPDALDGKLVTLAALHYQQDSAETAPGVKSASYSEGNVSQSETYQTATDYQAAMDSLLAGLARYRLVSVRGEHNADKTNTD